jgi:Ca2+-binding EF-hand superfamily protein
MSILLYAVCDGFNMRALKRTAMIFLSPDRPTKKETLFCVFHQVDRNHDGFVSRADVQYAIDHRCPKEDKIFCTMDNIMSRCDLNHDGIVTIPEAMHAPQCMNRLEVRKLSYIAFSCANY